ncbi:MULTISPECIES: hypothetical protein [unclassified Novosphingobium]|uniref:hypothetical protein n=1 Tax=unclassified Novosphingobium TaxID=2644732 RepID=UPI0025D8D3F1|nr:MULTISPECIES: hypothetical protein [unclassified Novosphingobium]
MTARMMDRTSAIVAQRWARGCKETDALPSYVAELELNKFLVDLVIERNKNNFPRPIKRPGYGFESFPYLDDDQLTFVTATGGIVLRSGTSGRVLYLLATIGEGFTSWECQPWITNLSDCIRDLRRSGLEIHTIFDGISGRARYRLRSPGVLIIERLELPTATGLEGAAS